MLPTTTNLVLTTILPSVMTTIVPSVTTTAKRHLPRKEKFQHPRIMVTSLPVQTMAQAQAIAMKATWVKELSHIKNAWSSVSGRICLISLKYYWKRRKSNSFGWTVLCPRFVLVMRANTTPFVVALRHAPVFHAHWSTVQTRYCHQSVQD